MTSTSAGSSATTASMADPIGSMTRPSVPMWTAAIARVEGRSEVVDDETRRGRAVDVEAVGRLAPGVQLGDAPGSSDRRS